MIIVTGGAGFIGSNLIDGLNRAGITDILVVDNLSNAAKHLNLNSLQFRDFLDKKTFLQKLDQFRDATAIFHQGACSSTTEADGAYMMDNNYQYSKELLHACLQNNIRFLYASSASVYGSGEHGFAEERRCEYPLNVYAFSKYSFDNYVRRLLPQVTSQVVGLRYFNVYGMQENHKEKMASVAFHLFQQIQENNTMKLFVGSEEFLRDFVFVEDVIKINLFFYENGMSGIFNVGSGKARSFVDIAKALQVQYPESVIQNIPFPEELQGKYQKFTEANLMNLRKVGYRPEMISLEEGITHYSKILQQTGGYLR